MDILGGSSYLENIREFRGWIITLGITLSIIGLIMIGSAYATSVFTIALIGFLAFLGGIVQCIHSFWVKKWGGFFLSLIGGLLLLFIGLFILSKPIISLQAITLILALYFMASGLTKIIFSLWARFFNWGWMFFSGLVSIFLGLLIWSQWPASSLYIVGLFLGIDLLILGVSWLVASASAGHIPSGGARPAI